MKIYYHRARGSTTVEAAVLIPFIILVIIAVIYVGLLLYESSHIKSAADKSIQEGSAYWRNLSSDIATGKTDMKSFENKALYWRIFDSTENEKLKKIENRTKELLKKRCILRPSSYEVKVELRNYIINKRLVCTIEGRYFLPGVTLLKIFGLNGKFKIRAESFSNINDPSEFIRNTDFLLNIEKELEDSYPGLKNIADKSRSVLEDIKANIDKFSE